MQQETYESSRKTKKAERMSRIVAKVMNGEALLDAEIEQADCDIAVFDMQAARESLPQSLKKAQSHRMSMQVTVIQNVGHHLGKEFNCKDNLWIT